MYGIVARKRKDSENRIYLDMLVYSAHMVIIYIGVSLLHKLQVSDNALFVKPFVLWTEQSELWTNTYAGLNDISFQYIITVKPTSMEKYIQKMVPKKSC